MMHWLGIIPARGFVRKCAPSRLPVRFGDRSFGHRIVFAHYGHSALHLRFHFLPLRARCEAERICFGFDRPIFRVLVIGKFMSAEDSTISLPVTSGGQELRLHLERSSVPDGVKQVVVRPARIEEREYFEDGRRGISRSVVNFWLDSLLLALFVLLGITAVIVQFVFPPAAASRGWTLWGFTFGGWLSVQFGLLAVLAFGIVVHLMLHWSWVCGVAARQLARRPQVPDSGLQTIYGVGLLIAVLLLGATVVGAATMTIRMPPIP